MDPAADARRGGPRPCVAAAPPAACRSYGPPARSSAATSRATPGATRKTSTRTPTAGLQPGRSPRIRTPPRAQRRSLTASASADNFVALDPRDCRCGGAPDSKWHNDQSRRGARKRTEMVWPSARHPHTRARRLPSPTGLATDHRVGPHHAHEREGARRGTETTKHIRRDARRRPRISPEGEQTSGIGPQPPCHGGKVKAASR